MRYSDSENPYEMRSSQARIDDLQNELSLLMGITFIPGKFSTNMDEMIGRTEGLQSVVNSLLHNRVSREIDSNDFKVNEMMTKLNAQITFYRRKFEVASSSFDTASRENMKLWATIGSLQEEIDGKPIKAGSQNIEDNADRNEILRLKKSLSVLESALLAANQHKSALQNRIDKVERSSAKYPTGPFAAAHVLEIASALRDEVNILRNERKEILAILSGEADNKLSTRARLFDSSNLLHIVELAKTKLTYPGRESVDKTLALLQDYLSNREQQVGTELDTPPSQNSPGRKNKSMKPIEVEEIRSVSSDLPIPLWCMPIARPVSSVPPTADRPVSAFTEYQYTGTFDISGASPAIRSSMAPVIGVHAGALRERVAHLEEKRAIDQERSEKYRTNTSSVVHEEKKIKSSWGLGSFAFFRKGDVNSMHLQVEHLKLEVSKREEEMEKLRFDQISSDIKKSKIFLCVVEEEVLSVAAENADLKKRLNAAQMAAAPHDDSELLVWTIF